MAFGVLPFCYVKISLTWMRHSNSYYLFLILQIDLRDKGALEMVFASTRYNFHLFSCSAVLTLFHFQIIINSFLFCKFLSSMFFIVRQFALQIWCCRPLCWTQSCGWKCAEAIAILWQQCHWTVNLLEVMSAHGCKKVFTILHIIFLLEPPF